MVEVKAGAVTVVEEMAALTVTVTVAMGAGMIWGGLGSAAAPVLVAMGVAAPVLVAMAAVAMAAEGTVAQVMAVAALVEVMNGA